METHNYTNGLITIRINTTKLVKDLMVKGKQGTWLGCVLIPSPNSEYGYSHFIAQEVSQEERLLGNRGPIVGNAKTFPQHVER